MRGRLDDLMTLQRVAAGELPDLTADVPWDRIRSVMGIDDQFDPAADSAELADMAADQIDEAALALKRRRSSRSSSARAGRTIGS